MIEFRLVRFMSPGVAVLARDRLGSSDEALWARCRARVRRGGARHRCVVCDRTIERGDVVWRPVGNQLYRSERICGHFASGCLPEPTLEATLSGAAGGGGA